MKQLAPRQLGIDENLNAERGPLISQALLQHHPKLPDESGVYPNNSICCDQVIPGLASSIHEWNVTIKFKPLIPTVFGAIFEWLACANVAIISQSFTIRLGK